MTITGANATIRVELDEAAGRRALQLLAVHEQRVLIDLESQLEELHLKGYKRIPATFEFPSGLSGHARQVVHRGMVIRRAIERIFEDLMDQPLPEWNRRMAKHGVYPGGQRIPLHRGARYHSLF